MTSSIRWEPIEDLKALRKMFNRTLVRRAFGRRQRHSPTSRWMAGRPLVDIYEAADAFTAEVNMPGVKAADLDVSVTGSVLTIKGERKVPEGREYLCYERPVGQFWRSLTLPREVDVDKICAKLGDGVLVLMMPKSAEATEVKIDVKPTSERGAGDESRKA